MYHESNQYSVKIGEIGITFFNFTNLIDNSSERESLLQDLKTELQKERNWKIVISKE
jgi:hypothetical protein